MPGGSGVVAATLRSPEYSITKNPATTRSKREQIATTIFIKIS
jgi:hypothetical protein